MSEPDGAFLRLWIDRAALVRWLDAPPSQPSRWDDWGGIGGSWYLVGGPRPLRETPAESAGFVAQAGAALARCRTNRGALWTMFCASSGTHEGASEETQQTRHIAFDAGKGAFTAGALLYTEGLDHLIAFLAVARGAADALGPDGSGVAVVHDYVFGRGDGGGTTKAAVRLGSGGASRLVDGEEAAEASRVFQPIADRALADFEAQPEPVDELDDLR